MSLYIASINSGSNGNCYYIGNDTEAVLVDAGISCRETERRMRRLDLSMSKVKAIFISHEHIDHIRGMQVLSSKHKIPVYITAATLANSRMHLNPNLVHPIVPYQPITINGVTVTAFPKEHDAADPHSFIVSDHEVNVGVITDIGTACTHVTDNFKKCHAAFLEANYDETMLEEGNYPIHLKRRIRGGSGHISNTQALELFTAHRSGFLSHLLLSHLSKNNNKPEIVSELFSPFAKEMNIVIASRYNETEVYHVQNTLPTSPQRHAKAAKAIQTSLF
jgi:phosphoribosyl 1,2-cyclic phosphodiesterase